MKKKRDKRWRFWADSSIQGRLAARIAVYWVVCQLAMVATMVGMSFLLQGSPTTGDSTIWSLIIPGFTVSALVLPFALFDAVVFSNRFAGPMMRLRKHLAELADKGSAEELRFRKNDFYGEVADDLNEFRRSFTPADSVDDTACEEHISLPTLQMNSPIGSENHV